MAKRQVTKDTPMEDIFDAFPSAPRVLFQRYHIGGCAGCGYEPSDSLEKVCAAHGISDLDQVVQTILESQDLEARIQITAKDAAELWKRGEVKLLDVRGEEERSLASIEGVPMIDQKMVREILDTWPKDTPIVFHCHHGIRSLDAATYFLGYGFTNVRSMAGGIDAWSGEVDSTVPRY